MKIYLKILIISLLGLTLHSTLAQSKIDWNGYLQYRFSDNYLNQTDFSVRRAKFWVDGSLPTDNGDWGYKL